MVCRREGHHITKTPSQAQTQDVLFRPFIDTSLREQSDRNNAGSPTAQEVCVCSVSTVACKLPLIRLHERHHLHDEVPCEKWSQPRSPAKQIYGYIWQISHNIPWSYNIKFLAQIAVDHALSAQLKDFERVEIMPQPSTPLEDPTPLLASTNRPLLTKAEYDDLFDSDSLDEPVFSSNNSPKPNDYDFDFGDVGDVTFESSTTSLTSNLEHLAYNHGNRYKEYPPLDPTSPQAYPIAIRQTPGPYTTPQLNGFNSFGQRPSPQRFQTNTAYPIPIGTPQGRRRSLSDSAAHRLPSPNPVPNPTFVRLQASRSRSAIPEEKHRGTPYTQHARSSSHGPGHPLKFTRALHRGSPLAGDILGTLIGTPLDKVSSEDDACSPLPSYRVAHHHHHHHHGEMMSQADDGLVVVRHMARSDALARSRKILEIGLMAVTKKGSDAIDADLHIAPMNAEQILKKVKEIEYYFENKMERNEEALRGCALIREAISIQDVDEGVLDESALLDAPSRIFAEMDCDVFDGCNDDGNELMTLLLQDGVEHGV